MFDASPPSVPRSVLKPELFVKRGTVQAALVERTRVAEILASKEARRVLLDKPKIKTVASPPDPAETEANRLVLLRSDTVEELDPEGLVFVKERATRFQPFTIELTYEYWNAHEILTSVLPLNILVPSAYTEVGHIIHVNLLHQHLPHKSLIGEVLLSKSAHTRTVVRKTQNIDTKYRFFQMELLAGEPDYIVSLVENGFKYTFDFRTVYYNTRLQNEHARLVSNFVPTSLIADVFGGVGPFSVPAAKKGCAVLLNDLNPEAISWAEKNIELNGVQKLVRPSNLDGVDFIRDSAVSTWHDPFPAYSKPQTSDHRKGVRHYEQKLQKRSPERLQRFLAKKAAAEALPGRRVPTDYVMNLPSTAYLFLFAFRGYLRPIMGEPGFSDVYGKNGRGMPMIHLYFFSREREPDQVLADVLGRASSSLSYTIAPTSKYLTLTYVRNVAPVKEMWCLSFRLPYEVAVADEVSDNELRWRRDELERAHTVEDDHDPS